MQQINQNHSNTNPNTKPSPLASEQVRVDIKQEITNKIISLLEKGTNPFKTRWLGGLPMNAQTGVYYKGINVLLLMLAAADAGYESNVWVTYKQAEAMGGQVRKGECATRGIFYTTALVAEKNRTGDLKKDQYFMGKALSLFNVAQVDGLDSTQWSEAHLFDGGGFIEAADEILNCSGADFEFGNRACYIPSADKIIIPHPELCRDTSSRYQTIMHELTHWTGHAKRLNRDFSGNFGDSAYAFEELVAELGSAFLNCHLGLTEESSIENHASYIDSWLTVLKKDKNAVLLASKLAHEAFVFITSKVIRERAVA
ncbi:MAG: ArdC family protein [Formosimonas sp.]